MVKETKIIDGIYLRQTDEKRTWRCTVKTENGEIITIPFEVFLDFVSDYAIEVAKYGDHYRARSIVKYRKGNF